MDGFRSLLKEIRDLAVDMTAEHNNDSHSTSHPDSSHTMIPTNEDHASAPKSRGPPRLSDFTPQPWQPSFRPSKHHEKEISDIQHITNDEDTMSDLIKEVVKTSAEQALVHDIAAEIVSFPAHADARLEDLHHDLHFDEYLTVERRGGVELAQHSVRSSTEEELLASEELADLHLWRDMDAGTDAMAYLVASPEPHEFHFDDAVDLYTQVELVHTIGAESAEAPSATDDIVDALVASSNGFVAGPIAPAPDTMQQPLTSSYAIVAPPMTDAQKSLVAQTMANVYHELSISHASSHDDLKFLVPTDAQQQASYHLTNADILVAELNAPSSSSSSTSIDAEETLDALLLEARRVQWDQAVSGKTLVKVVRTVPMSSTVSASSKGAAFSDSQKSGVEEDIYGTAAAKNTSAVDGDAALDAVLAEALRLIELRNLRLRGEKELAAAAFSNVAMKKKSDYKL